MHGMRRAVGQPVGAAMSAAAIVLNARPRVVAVHMQIAGEMENAFANAARTHGELLSDRTTAPQAAEPSRFTQRPAEAGRSIEGGLAVVVGAAGRHAAVSAEASRHPRR